MVFSYKKVFSFYVPYAPRTSASMSLWRLIFYFEVCRCDVWKVLLVSFLKMIGSHSTWVILTWTVLKFSDIIVYKFTMYELHVITAHWHIALNTDWMTYLRQLLWRIERRHLLDILHREKQRRFCFTRHSKNAMHTLTRTNWITPKCELRWSTSSCTTFIYSFISV